VTASHNVIHVVSVMKAAQLGNTKEERTADRTMKEQSYHSSITAKVSPAEAFERISRISDWWTAGVNGKSRNVGDRFTVRWGETFVTFEVIESISNKKAVWLVTDCNLNFVTDKTEWKDTKVVWDLAPENGATHVTITHVGLVPGIECYDNCVSGWNFYFGESLLKLLTEGRGLPDKQGSRRDSDWVSAYIAQFAALLEEPSKPFTLLARMSVKPGMQEKLEKAWLKARAGTQGEAGAIVWHLNRDATDSTRYAVYERWQSLVDLERHLRTSYITTLKQEFDEALAAAPEFSVLVPASE
jgi:quinol monooxygenase YgiN